MKFPAHDNRFGDTVAVVPPDKVEKFITSEARIVGITSNDPFGIGPTSTTFAGTKGLVKEESYNVWKSFTVREGLRIPACPR